jgi:hypothetical protein
VSDIWEIELHTAESLFYKPDNSYIETNFEKLNGINYQILTELIPAGGEIHNQLIIFRK